MTHNKEPKANWKSTKPYVHQNGKTQVEPNYCRKTSSTHTDTSKREKTSVTIPTLKSRVASLERQHTVGKTATTNVCARTHDDQRFPPIKNSNLTKMTNQKSAGRNVFLRSSSKSLRRRQGGDTFWREAAEIQRPERRGMGSDELLSV